MSDVPQGPGWWQASDLRWYPPEAVPGPEPTPPPWSPPPAYPPPTQGAPGYGPVGYGYVHAPSYGPTLPSVNGFATASLVLGILSLLLCACWFLVLPTAIAGLALGLVAHQRIRAGEADPNGQGTALAGAICSGLALGLALLLLAAQLAL